MTQTSPPRHPRLLSLLASGLLLSACATTANYEAILRTWVAQPVDRLVMAWGPPQSTYLFSPRV
jgi:hypothetical protein